MSQINDKQTMTSDERKAEYRDLLDRVENLHENEDIGLDTTYQINDILQRVNALFKEANIKEQSKHTDEVLLDAKVIATASDVLLNITDAIDCTLDTYDSIDFSRRIRTKLVNDDVDEDSDMYYAKLIETTQNFIRKVPNFCPFYGPIGDPTAQPKPPKERKPRVQNKKDEQAAKKAPEKITHADKEEDSVDDTVKFLQWSLTKIYEENGEKPINYFIFTIDPNCFTTTIENMFHLSFLVRDGRAKIAIDKRGNMTVYPVSGSDAKKAKKGEVTYKQSIVSIDMDEWTELIDAFNIKTNFLGKWRHLWDERKKHS